MTAERARFREDGEITEALQIANGLGVVNPKDYGAKGDNKTPDDEVWKSLMADIKRHARKP